MESRDDAEVAGLQHVATELHADFDDRLGTAVVDQQIAATGARFGSARIRTFVPLFVHRYAQEELQRLVVTTSASPPDRPS